MNDGRFIPGGTCTDERTYRPQELGLYPVYDLAEPDCVSRLALVGLRPRALIVNCSRLYYESPR